MPIPCRSIFFALTWIFFFTFSISTELCISFFPFGRHLLLFPSTRWESLSTLLLPAYLSHFLRIKFFKRIILIRLLFFLNSNSILSPRQAVSTVNGVLQIEFCIFLSPFRMGLTNPGRAFGRSSQLLISRKLLTLTGIPPFSTNSFRLTSFLALLVVLNLSFLIGALAWFIKITKVASFESVEVFCKDPFLAALFSSMIFLLLSLLPSAALSSLTTWLFGPPPTQFPLQWRPRRSSVSIGALVGIVFSFQYEQM